MGTEGAFMPKREGLKELQACRCGRTGHVVNFGNDLTYYIACKCGRFIQHVDQEVCIEDWNYFRSRPSADLPMDVDKVELELCRAKQDWISFEVDGKTLQRAQAEAIVQLSATPMAKDLSMEDIAKQLDKYYKSVDGYNRIVATAIHQAMSGGATNPGENEAVDLLKLILPMAKGYAHNNPVGNNQQFIKDAEEFLSKHNSK